MKSRSDPVLTIVDDRKADLIQAVEAWTVARGVARDAARDCRPAQVLAERHLEHSARALEEAYFAWIDAVERGYPEIGGWEDE